MSNIIVWRGALIPVVIAGLMTLVGNVMGDRIAAGQIGPQLDPPAARQDVYVVGNSMFGTGLDLEALRADFPEKSIDFGYYNGHYTSMWHLAATVGLSKSNAPQTVVWGFRPTYAILPAFRQNKDTLETEFAAVAPSAHRAILARANDPNAIDVADTESQSQQNDFAGSASNEPFENLGARMSDFIKHPFDLLNGTSNGLSASVNVVSNGVMTAAVKSFGVPQLKNGDEWAKSSDLLISYVTGGRVKRADALVIDNGERFVKGDEMPFDQSFSPLISQAISDRGSQQIVVIFKPVNLFTSPLPAETQAYYEDALAYFAERDIPVVDLISDPKMTKDLYAKGDHFTQDGMAHVTRRISETIANQQ